MRSELLNGGAYARTAFAAINKTATAAGSGDATEVDGDWIDRIFDADAEGGMAMSAKLVIAYTTTLQHTETLKFGVQFRDATSIAGAGADDYEAAVAQTTVATGESGGSTIKGTFEVDIDLSHAKRFIQAQVTPNLSAGGTDTAEWAAVLVLFGHNRVPISRSPVALGSPT